MSRLNLPTLRGFGYDPGMRSAARNDDETVERVADAFNVRRVGVNDKFEHQAAQVESILANAQIVMNADEDVYEVVVDGELILSVPAKNVRRQSFSLTEYLARQLRGILCVLCGRRLIGREEGICSRCEARKVFELIALRDRRRAQ